MSKINHRDGTKARQDFPSGYRFKKGALKNDSNTMSRRATAVFIAGVRTGHRDPFNTPINARRAYGNPWNWD